eukprot:TRINITY_DN12820_c0_g1_i1.p1 TRINITY_DN12820_c0_g1~~TRINITY_DN12820_c0_g1_i1.p1  ORF type:complete len:632 (+),score=154.37 TRINITY_DN12820_c0_g1_i1:701-2596(+)
MKRKFETALSEITASAQGLAKLVDTVVDTLSAVKHGKNQTPVTRLESEVIRLQQLNKLARPKLSDDVLELLESLASKSKLAGQVNRGIVRDGETAFLDKTSEVLQSRLTERTQQLRQQIAFDREAAADAGVQKSLKTLALGDQRRSLVGVCEYIVGRSSGALQMQRTQHVADVFGAEEGYHHEAGMLVLAQEMLERIDEAEFKAQLCESNTILKTQVGCQQKWEMTMDKLQDTHDRANVWINSMVVPKGLCKGVWRPAALAPLLYEAQSLLTTGGASCRNHHKQYEPPRDKVEDRKIANAMAAKGQEALTKFDKAIRYRSRVTQALHQQVAGRGHLLAACKQLRAAQEDLRAQGEKEPWGPTFKGQTPPVLQAKLDEMGARLRQDNLGLWALLRQCVVPDYADPGSIMEYWLSTARPDHVSKPQLLERLRGAGFGQSEFRLRVWCGLFGVLMVLVGVTTSVWALLVINEDAGSVTDSSVENFSIVAVAEAVVLLSVGVASLVLSIKDPARHNLVPLCVVLFLAAAAQLGFAGWCLFDEDNARSELLGENEEAHDIWDDHSREFIATVCGCALMEVLCAVLFLQHRRLHQKKLAMWGGSRRVIGGKSAFDEGVALPTMGSPAQAEDDATVLV